MAGTLLTAALTVYTIYGSILNRENWRVAVSLRALVGRVDYPEGER